MTANIEMTAHPSSGNYTLLCGDCGATYVVRGYDAAKAWQAQHVCEGGSDDA